MSEKTVEVMTYPLPRNSGIDARRYFFSETVKAMKHKTAVVIGPGLGGGGNFDYVRRVVEKCSELGLPVVIDADGLNAISEDISILKRASKKGARIITTPHPGEAARLLE